MGSSRYVVGLQDVRSYRIFSAERREKHAKMMRNRENIHEEKWLECLETKEIKFN